MRSLSTTVGRACTIGGLGIVLAGAAWALPAADEPTIESAGAGPVERVSAPAVDLPELADATDEEAPAEEKPVKEAIEPAADATAASRPIPDHLVVDDAEALATTTTTTTTTTAPPPPTTTAAPVATVAFSATQKYGSCGEDVPYDVFSGTATPGSTVSVSSAYGSGSATAEADGHWSTKVEFPSAPRNETFAVSVSGPGGSKTLHFTATGDVHHDA